MRTTQTKKAPVLDPWSVPAPADDRAWEDDGDRHRLSGANLDIDLLPAPGVTWPQAGCPWTAVDGEPHRCAVKGGRICTHFRGVEYLDTVVCAHPGKTRYW